MHPTVYISLYTLQCTFIGFGIYFENLVADSKTDIFKNFVFCEKYDVTGYQNLWFDLVALCHPIIFSK